MTSITLVGDRQAGKTHALLNLGAAEASSGRRVAYVHDQQVCVGEAFRRYEQQVDETTVERFYRTNGQQRVAHIGGGIIHFSTTGRRKTWNLTDIDVLLIDESGYDVCTDPVVGWPNIRIFRTSL